MHSNAPLMCWKYYTWETVNTARKKHLSHTLKLCVLSPPIFGRYCQLPAPKTPPPRGITPAARLRDSLQPACGSTCGWFHMCSCLMLWWLFNGFSKTPIPEWQSHKSQTKQKSYSSRNVRETTEMIRKRSNYWADTPNTLLSLTYPPASHPQITC